MVFGISLKNQLMFGGIALAALSLAVLFPEQLGGILSTAIGTFDVPIIGALTVEKIVAVVGVVTAADMLIR